MSTGWRGPGAALWTGRQRRKLGKLFDAVAPDLERAFRITRELVSAMGRAIPSEHEGIDLMPLLEHKLAGYNADLFAHVVRLMRSDAAAGEFVGRHRARRYTFPFRDMYLAEHCLGASLEKAGGRLAGRHESVRGRAALAARYRPRCTSPGYEPLEIPLGLAEGQGEGGGEVALDHSGDGGAVLFVASMNNYLNPMTPVISRLVEMGRRPVVLLPAGSERWPAAAGLGRGVRRVLVPGPETAVASRVFEAQRGRYAALWERHGLDVARCFCVNGVDLWSLVGADVERFVRDYFPYAIACIELGRDLVDRLGIASVAVARLRRATESALAAGFRSRGVPVTMIVHGHVSNSPERRFDAGSFSGADRVCVWGSEQRRQVLESAWAPPEEGVVEVGNPAWDGLIAGCGRDRAALRRALAERLDLDPAAVWGVLTSQTLALHQFADVVEAFRSEPGSVLIVKVHPAEDPAWYRARVGVLPGARVLAHGEVELHDLLAGADLTLTFSSTTNLESMLLGTPVVTYVFGALGAQDRAVYLEKYGLPLARNREELAALLHRVARDPAEFRRDLAPAMRRALESNLANHADAGASARVAGLLLGGRPELR